jgi:hypothetical protein
LVVGTYGLFVDDGQRTWGYWQTYRRACRYRIRGDRRESGHQGGRHWRGGSRRRGLRLKRKGGSNGRGFSQGLWDGLRGLFNRGIQRNLNRSFILGTIRLRRHRLLLTRRFTRAFWRKRLLRFLG